jgi:tetratricopeptide (TPR) repeat protein
MSDGAFPDRLSQLRNRWEADPSSRIFLQLAEEYRHQGRVKEALDVLDRGLKEHPGYLSALVAKGRCHLELGEPEPARTVLERVVKQDATQMVANKLLVRAYLDTGEPDLARERLDLYSLLNDSDPEIEELRRRLRAMEQPPQARTPDPFQAPDSPLSQMPQMPQMPQTPQTPQAVPASASAASAPPPGQPRPGGDIFDLGLPAPRRASADVFELEAPAPVAVAVAEALPAEPAEEPEPEDVLFPGLASRDSRRRYLDHLGSEGIFLLDLTPAEPPPVIEIAEIAEVAEVAEPEPVWTEPEPLPVPTPVEDEPTEVWSPARPVQEIREEPAPVFDFEEPAPWAPEPLAAEAAEAAEIAEPSALPLQVTLAMPVIPEVPGVPAPGPVATATLGEIYLSQGHLGEAERIFHEVLRREPDSADARVGLERLAARRAERRPLSSRDLLAGYEPGEEGGEAELRSRKAWVLTEYLRRLRGGDQRDVS